MQAAFNYLLRKQPQEISLVNDGYVKGAAAGLGLLVGVGGIVYAAANVGSYITKENAHYCAIQTMATLAEVQRQIQMLNASCTYDPVFNMSTCNVTLLPKPVNTSCADVAVADFTNYVPVMFAVAGLVTFGLFMGRSILASIDQRNEQLQRARRAVISSENFFRVAAGGAGIEEKQNDLFSPATTLSPQE